MIEVKIELHDTVEIGAFHQFSQAIEKYRTAKDAEERARWAGQTGGSGQTGGPVTDAQYEQPAQPKQVIATITPAGVVKAPKADELMRAAQAYAQKHGLPEALAIVREFGATRVGEVTDPDKMAALFERFTQ